MYMKLAEFLSNVKTEELDLKWIIEPNEFRPQKKKPAQQKLIQVQPITM